jgi:hypothetical protein
MYKKCFSEKMNNQYYDELNHYIVYIREKQIKNPKIDYYKLNWKEVNPLLIIDENGMNFLKDNYPHLKQRLSKVDKSEFNETIIYKDVKLKNGNTISDTITKKVVGYKFISYNSKNKIIEEENYKEKLLGIDKLGNQIYWNSQKQIIINHTQYLGNSGNRFYQHPNHRLRLKKKDLQRLFNPQYFENIKIGENGKWIGKVLPKEERNW